MSNDAIFTVEVVAAEALFYSAIDKNKKGRPIMAPYGTSLKKGAQFAVDATARVSAADTGDGIVHADGGVPYYFLGVMPGLYVRTADVTKVATHKKDKTVEVYTVVEGDSLSAIAEKYYKNGDEKHYMVIFNANTNILKKPGEIFPGQKLVIPKY